MYRLRVLAYYTCTCIYLIVTIYSQCCGFTNSQVFFLVFVLVGIEILICQNQGVHLFSDQYLRL